jgi:endonuclease III
MNAMPAIGTKPKKSPAMHNGRALTGVERAAVMMLALGQEGLEAYIKTIGLYRTKAKNILETCRLLVERHGGEVPDSREALKQDAKGMYERVMKAAS